MTAHVDRPQPPADQGLSSLGLLMALTGSITAPLVAAQALGQCRAEHELVEEVAPGATWLVLVLVAGFVRSLAHRRAGLGLWRTVPTNPPVLTGVSRYVVAAALHTAACIGYGISRWHVGPGHVVLIAAMSMAWPLAVWAVLRLRRFQELGPRPPIAEDSGFEGLAVLMAVLGFVGIMALLVVATSTWPMASTDTPSQTLWITCVAALAYRSYYHLTTGVGALRGDPLRAGPAFERYGDVGVAVGGLVGGALLLWLYLQAIDLIALATAVAIMITLIAWPALVRRFVQWHAASEVRTGRVPRPSPDGGVTALGWLLLAGAAFAVSSSAIAMFASAPFAAQVQKLHGLPFPSELAWWALPLGLLQLWAALELLAVSPRRRLAANAWAVAAVIAPVAFHAGTLWRLLDAPFEERTVGLARFLVVLTPAVATLLLVNRRPVPRAIARMVTPPSAPPAT